MLPLMEYSKRTLGRNTRFPEVPVVPRMSVNDAVGMSRCTCVVEVESPRGVRTARAKGNESRRHEEWTATNSRVVFLRAPSQSQKCSRLANDFGGCKNVKDCETGRQTKQNPHIRNKSGTPLIGVVTFVSIGGIARVQCYEALML